MDLFGAAIGGSLYAQLGELSSLQANTDHRLTGTTDRLTALEHRYERMQLIMLALWSLLKQHSGLTDEDLKGFIHSTEASNAHSTESAAVMTCEHCHRIIRKSATRCVWCGAAVNTGNAFEGT